jgi:hypothetical protein
MIPPGANPIKLGTPKILVLALLQKKFISILYNYFQYLKLHKRMCFGINFGINFNAQICAKKIGIVYVKK